MVQQIETIARKLDRDSPSEFSKEVIQAVEKSRRKGNAPEVLEGVVLYDRDSEKDIVYDHFNFVHDRLEQHLIFKAGPKDGLKVRLSSVENNLLIAFEKSPDRTISKPEFAVVFGKEKIRIGTVRNSVSRLRKKVGPENILTLRGVGYKFIDHRTEVNPSQEVERVHLHSGFKHHPERSSVVVDGRNVSLEPTPNSVLDLLAQNIGKIVTPAMFKRGLWRGKNVNIVSVLRRHISTIRDILEPGKKQGEFEYLLNVRGKGYKLVDPKKAENPNSVTLFERLSA